MRAWALFSESLVRNCRQGLQRWCWLEPGPRKEALDPGWALRTGLPRTRREDGLTPSGSFFLQSPKRIKCFLPVAFANGDFPAHVFTGCSLPRTSQSLGPAPEILLKPEASGPRVSERLGEVSATTRRPAPLHPRGPVFLSETSDLSEKMFVRPHLGQVEWEAFPGLSRGCSHGAVAVNAGAAGHTHQSRFGGRCPPDVHSPNTLGWRTVPGRQSASFRAACIHGGRSARPLVTGEAASERSSHCGGPRLKPHLCPAARLLQPAFLTPSPGSRPSITPVYLHRPLGLHFWGADLRRG